MITFYVFMKGKFMFYVLQNVNLEIRPRKRAGNIVNINKFKYTSIEL